MVRTLLGDGPGLPVVVDVIPCESIKMKLNLIFCLLVALGSTAYGATEFTASVDADQVNPPFGVEGDPAGSRFSGTASLQFQPATGGEGPRLTYRLDLPGMDLDGSLTPADFSDDVTAIHIHAGEFGGNGPHVLNVYGFSGGQIREDDADLVVNPALSFVTGVWDDGDQLFTGPGGARQMFDSAALSTHLQDLQSGGLYFQIHTLNFPNGELRGQIVPVPEPGVLTLWVMAVCAVIPLVRKAGATLR